MKGLIFFSLFFLAISFPSFAFASVFINEIAWMGTRVSANDEWIELYNNSDTEIDLSGWKLSSKDGSPKINLLGKIKAQSFYFLERTDDNSVLNISADQIYTGSLGNNGEYIELYDNANEIVDYVDCSKGWFAGDNTTKKTMERIGYSVLENNVKNWATSVSVEGTPKATNSEQPKQLIQKKPEIEITDGIFINEVLPSPSGSDDQNEWIEIYNQNTRKINLSGWKLKDKEGVKTTFTFPNNTFIDAEGFLIFPRNKTKITLNNDGDGLSLIKPNGEEADSVIFPEAPTDQSYNRIDNIWEWSTTLTPGEKNALNNKDNDPEIKVPSENNSNDLPLVGNNKNRLSLILEALFVGMLCGAIILFIKKKLNKQIS